MQKIDEFAQIGNRNQFYRRDELEEKLPIELPDILLPLEDKLSARFEPVHPISTKEELQKELVLMREKYSQYMKNHAPSLRSDRIRHDITEFNWRKQTNDDLFNFSNVLAGWGNWDKVAIPHFGPPLGEATTYYFTRFNLTEEMLGSRSQFACFKAVDYKAEVYVNSCLVGAHEGFFAPFEFDFSSVARLGENTLLVVVKNDFIARRNENDEGEMYGGDKIYAATNLGYDDPELGWHHGPAGMGIYQDVYIEARPTIHIHNIFVRPMLDRNQAEAWIEVYNSGLKNQSVSLNLSLYGQNFKENIFEDLLYTPETVVVPGSGDLAKPTDNLRSKLYIERGINYLKVPFEIKNPRIWNNETPWLYQLQVKINTEYHKNADALSSQFGMRSFSMDTLSEVKGKMYLNGNEIRLRGANTMGHLQQCVFKKDWDKLRDDILLAKICNMNFLRLTQRPVQPEIYDYCDRLGLMTQTDLPLFGVLRRNKVAEAVKQAEEMERLVRGHACNIMVSYINERFPNGEGSPHRHLSTLKEYNHFFTAADQLIHLSNPDRVIKAGDGDYDPPSPGLPDSHCYNGWYNGHGLPLGKLQKGYWQWIKPNWYFGCGEFGAEGLDPINVMRKYYPENWLPKNDVEEKNWNPGQISKCQTNDFHYMWFNTQHSVQNWIEASQAHQEWVIRYMTEAFRREQRMVTFAVHLFIDAWPAGWMKSIMDVDRQPKKAYFAYKNALEPLIVNLRTDRCAFFSGDEMNIEAWICNDLNEAPNGTLLKYQFESNDGILWSNEVNAIIPINSSQFQGYINTTVPTVNSRTRFTLRLALFDINDKSLNQTSIEIEVFPKNEVSDNEQKVYIIGNKEGNAAKIVKEANLSLTNTLVEAQTILIENMAAYYNHFNQVDEAVRNGKVALFLSLNAGEYQIAESKVTISDCTMGNYFFVSPQTDHPMVKNFKPMDFKCWYNSEKEYVTPIISATFQANGWSPILSSGNTVWGQGSAPALAVAEKSVDKGFYRICQLDFTNKIKSNPIAYQFFLNVLK